MTVPTVPALSVPAITTDQMREVDRIMVEDLGIGLVRMMEHAGRLLAEVVRRLAAWEPGLPVTVLAGGGNNGGGGLVAARNLHDWGARVSVVLDRAPEEVRGVPAEQLAILGRIAVPVGVEPEEGAGAVVDALIGYGISGSPRGRAAGLIRWANRQRGPVVALDGPSGLDLTSGTAGNPCVRATATMTLALPKAGLLAPSARGVVGELYLADIGVPPEVYARIGLGKVWPFREGPLVRLAWD